MRYIRTKPDDNLTTIVRRVYCVEGGRALALARARVLELNPNLPDRRKIPADTFVVIPEEIDGYKAREGRGLGEATGEGVLELLRANLGRLDAAWVEQVREENAQHATAKKNLRLAHVRKACGRDPELAQRAKRLREVQQQRQKQTAEFESFRKSVVQQIDLDIASLSELTRTGLAD